MSWKSLFGQSRHTDWTLHAWDSQVKRLTGLWFVIHVTWSITWSSTVPGMTRCTVCSAWVCRSLASSRCFMMPGAGETARAPTATLVNVQIGRIIYGTIFGSCDGAVSWKSTTGPFTACQIWFHRAGHLITPQWRKSPPIAGHNITNMCVNNIVPWLPFILTVSTTAPLFTEKALAIQPKILLSAEPSVL